MFSANEKKNRKITRKTNLQNYKIRITCRDDTYFNVVIQLWARQIYTWRFGTRARQSGNSRPLPFSLPLPCSIRFSSFQFHEIRWPPLQLAVSFGHTAARVAICHGSLTIGVLTNVVVTRKAAPVRRKRRTLSALLAAAASHYHPSASKRCKISDNY